jgi:hypothetical protein
MYKCKKLAAKRGGRGRHPVKAEKRNDYMLNIIRNGQIKYV